MIRRRLRWAVFVSGTGSNFSAFLDHRPFLDIGLLISSKKNAPAIVKAKRSGVTTYVLNKKIDWSDLTLKLKEYRIDRIFLAGFMKIVPEDFLKYWSGKVINIHPSLLPHYKGLNSIERAYNDKAQLGCTLHEVIPEVDAGEIINSRRVDSSSTLARTELLVHLGEYKLVRDSIPRWSGI